ncbi:alpha/beta hydrolase [Maribellus maritimus]|uniref:alpha/beta hydrolase n=1 Tax=Maribellus maritimus TaxID=2870838 RepID=UPI001EE9BA1E|nr:alpha/beta hydrolase-fold protein [Maribellus maritimus]MCG6187789.1 esterase family protein [Maribellus maritimus]
MKKAIIIFLSLFIILPEIVAQTSSLKVNTTVSKQVRDNFINSGRIFLFINPNTRGEPRLNTFPSQTNYIFATNIENWEATSAFTFDGKTDVIKSVDISLNSLPVGKYRIQVLWDQDIQESRINAPGNLYSDVVDIDLQQNKSIEIPLTKIILPRKLVENKYLKEVNLKSELLSNWWGKDMFVKAAVLLPKSFYNKPDKKYPVRYNIAGYGGRYTRANRHVENNSFMEWYLSEEGPEMITVFLDGEGPFGDSYQLDSDNSGPYGTSLTEEVIPYIEENYRGVAIPESRYLDGCSTGGWVSLALQLFYPDFFNGCFSYSPDQVDFENCQLINIYKDDNAFYNEFGYLRPLVRDVNGEPMVSQKDYIQFENVQGSSDTYLNSGGQFSAFSALFSPKGENDLPKPLFDPATGKIDRQVAEYWRKHDLKDMVENNWETLGPKIQGKIWIWVADMDHFYLNPAMRAFDAMLYRTDDPKSDATIHFSPMKGHCEEYDFIKVYQQIQEKINPDK